MKEEQNHRMQTQHVQKAYLKSMHNMKGKEYKKKNIETEKASKDHNYHNGTCLYNQTIDHNVQKDNQNKTSNRDKKERTKTKGIKTEVDNKKENKKIREIGETSEE